MLARNRELREVLTSVNGSVKAAAEHADRLEKQSSELEQ